MSGTGVTARRPPGARPGVRDLRRVGPRGVLRVFVRMVNGTFRLCMKYRVTGLAAEAGFFALLSLPPLVLGLVASLGYASEWLGADLVQDLRQHIVDITSRALSDEAVAQVITPTFDEVASGGRLDIVSIGFLLSLWSGSRALNVYIDTVTIMYGLSGKRGIVATRALSFSMYVVILMLGAIVFPLIVIGPGLIKRFLSTQVDSLPSFAWASNLYWPTVILISIVMLTTLYHVATPVRVPWRREVPGAVLALVIWVVASAVLRLVVSASVGGTSIYGPLSAPIIILMWLYFLAIAVLIGAALNATLDDIWPDPLRRLARQELHSYDGWDTRR